MKVSQLVPMPLAATAETNLERTHEVGAKLDTVEPVGTGELRTPDMVDRLSTDDVTSTTFQ